MGRVVGERPWLGLVPGEAMLLAYHQRREEEEGEGEEGRSPGPVYEDAPIMRPIVLVGPSRKDAEVRVVWSRTATEFPRMIMTTPGHLVI